MFNKAIRVMSAVGPLLATTGAQAEVIDKIASVQQLWTTSFTLAALLGAFAYFLPSKSALTAVVCLFAVAYAWPPAVPAEFLPEAIQHYGKHYADHALVSGLLVPIAAIAGAVARMVRSLAVNQKNAA